MVNVDDLQNTYKVLETQDRFLSPLYTEFFGFQAMLLEDQNYTGEGTKYVIAFRGTGINEWIWNAVSDLASDFSMVGGNDLLEGGSGYDRYFAMSGDTVKDRKPTTLPIFQKAFDRNRQRNYIDQIVF